MIKTFSRGSIDKIWVKDFFNHRQISGYDLSWMDGHGLIMLCISKRKDLFREWLYMKEDNLMSRRNIYTYALKNSQENRMEEGSRERRKSHDFFYWLLWIYASVMWHWFFPSCTFMFVIWSCHIIWLIHFNVLNHINIVSYCQYVTMGICITIFQILFVIILKSALLLVMTIILPLYYYLC